MYPEEVEAALKSHPDVFDAVVVGIPDDRFGQRVAAVVQPRTGRARTSRSSPATAGRRSPATRCRASSTLVGGISRTPAGKPDYALGPSSASRGRARRDRPAHPRHHARRPGVPGRGARWLEANAELRRGEGDWSNGPADAGDAAEREYFERCQRLAAHPLRRAAGPASPGRSSSAGGAEPPGSRSSSTRSRPAST